ncbi:hypothetical protein ACFXPN_40085 [Streptomyces griseorubiginosus]|uniref:hypothetical protein n=1 Tax=Streptomyces griseorubiginosus TaxID=67304 RepID=UPI0036C5F11B
MERHKEEALAAALQDSEIGHIQHWLTHWRAQVEIERRPDLAARFHAALAVVHGTSGREDSAFRAAMNELRAVEAKARRAVSV